MTKHSIKIANMSFERMAKVQILTTQTDQNCMNEEIKNGLNSGMLATIRSIVLSSSLPSRNVKVKIHKTIILPVVLYGCETWSLTLRED
jgi:hypothetical protein